LPDHPDPPARPGLESIARRLAVVLIVLTCGLSLVLAGGLLFRASNPGSRSFGALDLLYGVGLVFPLATAVAVGLAASLAVAARRGGRGGPAPLAWGIAVAVLALAWAAGVRVPHSRSGEWIGLYVRDPVCCRFDIFVPEKRDRGSLPRGSDFADTRDATEGILFVSISNRRWAGPPLNGWPSTVSDSHGARSYCVRVVGRLTGPGQYGWPPVAEYRLRIDSVIAVTRVPPQRWDCGG
jgi:hypothetical protein